MSATISATNGAGSTSPAAVRQPYDTSWAGRNVIHNLVGGGIAVALVRPRPRAGRLDLVYNTEDDAFAGATLHTEETSFTLADPDAPHIGMTYVIDGSVTVTLDQDIWRVSIGYQEIETS